MTIRQAQLKLLDYQLYFAVFKRFTSKDEWLNLQFRDCNGESNGIDLPEEVLRQENLLGGVAGEGLGAEKTFDISKAGKGIFGVAGKSKFVYIVH